MKSKRWYVLAIATVLLIVVIGVSGCGGSKSSSDQKKAEDKTDYAVGETISYEGKEVTVVSAERNYDSGNQYYTSEA